MDTAYCIVCDKALDPFARAPAPAIEDDVATPMQRSSSEPFPTVTAAPSSPASPPTHPSVAGPSTARPKPPRSHVKRNASSGRLVSNRSGARLVAMTAARRETKAAIAHAARPAPARVAPRRHPFARGRRPSEDSDEERKRRVEADRFVWPESPEPDADRPDWMELYCSEACRDADEIRAGITAVELEAQARRHSQVYSASPGSSFASSSGSYMARRSMDSERSRRSSDSAGRRPLTPMTSLADARGPMPPPLVPRSFGSSDLIRPTLGLRVQSEGGPLRPPNEHPDAARSRRSDGAAPLSSSQRTSSFRGLESASLGRSTSSLLSARGSIAEPVVSGGPDAQAQGQLASAYSDEPLVPPPRPGRTRRRPSSPQQAHDAQYSKSPTVAPSIVNVHEPGLVDLSVSYGLYTTRRNLSGGFRPGSSPTATYVPSAATSVGTVAPGEPRAPSRDLRQSREYFPSSVPTNGLLVHGPSPLAGPRRNASMASVESMMLSPEISTANGNGRSAARPSSVRFASSDDGEYTTDSPPQSPGTPNTSAHFATPAASRSNVSLPNWMPPGLMYPVLDPDKLRRKREKDGAAQATIEQMAQPDEPGPPGETTLNRRKRLFYWAS